ncbi:MAG: dual specificity protein phosphatase family protein [Anaerolineales bacterium]|nr:dual specificity protein phosphatase family protein [Anaerolineales bacterium]
MPDWPRPFSNCYWVEPGRLLAGEYPGAPAADQARHKLRALLLAGLTDFVDLTEADEPLRPYAELLQTEAASLGLAVTHTRLAVPDMGVPAAAAQMTRILDTLDHALAAGRRAYVHCWGGVGRTGTVVGCYLVRRGAAGDTALAQIAAWWRTVPKSAWHPASPETAAQRAYVRGWREPAPRADPG